MSVLHVKCRESAGNVSYTQINSPITGMKQSPTVSCLQSRTRHQIHITCALSLSPMISELSERVNIARVLTRRSDSTTRSRWISTPAGVNDWFCRLLWVELPKWSVLVAGSVLCAYSRGVCVRTISSEYTIAWGSSVRQGARDFHDADTDHDRCCLLDMKMTSVRNHPVSGTEQITRTGLRKRKKALVPTQSVMMRMQR